MKQPRIKQVKDNRSKGKTYSMLIAKYNEAMKNEYYGEAELIVYAFIEDRLKSFIYHCDLIDRRNSRNLNNKTIELFGEDKKIDNLSVKIDIIFKMIKFCQDGNYKNNECVNYVRNMFLHYIDNRELKRILNDIKKWSGYRNEVVHALFNKDINDLRISFGEHVTQGYELARKLDKMVSAVKKC